MKSHRALRTCYEEAEKLAGRHVEVLQLTDGRFIVEWFAFNEPPPLPGSTELEALELFIEKMKSRAQLNLPNEDEVS